MTANLARLRRRVAALTAPRARAVWKRAVLTSGGKRGRIAELLLTARLRVALKREPTKAELLEALSAAGGERRVALGMGASACEFAARDMESRGDVARAQRMRVIAHRVRAHAAAEQPGAGSVAP